MDMSSAKVLNGSSLVLKSNPGDDRSVVDVGGELSQNLSLTLELVVMDGARTHELVREGERLAEESSNIVGLAGHYDATDVRAGVDERNQLFKNIVHTSASKHVVDSFNAVIGELSLPVLVSIQDDVGAHLAAPRGGFCSSCRRHDLSELEHLLSELNGDRTYSSCTCRDENRLASVQLGDGVVVGLRDLHVEFVFKGFPRSERGKRHRARDKVAYASRLQSSQTVVHCNVLGVRSGTYNAASEVNFISCLETLGYRQNSESEKIEVN